MALVPLNDSMTLDNDGNFNTDKTDAYRSSVDMAPLPAGESPGEYCSDLEQIQGSRLQEDVNLLIKGRARRRTRRTISSRSWRYGSSSRS